MSTKCWKMHVTFYSKFRQLTLRFLGIVSISNSTSHLTKLPRMSIIFSIWHTNYFSPTNVAAKSLFRYWLTDFCLDNAFTTTILINTLPIYEKHALPELFCLYLHLSVVHFEITFSCWGLGKCHISTGFGKFLTGRQQRSPMIYRDFEDFPTALQCVFPLPPLHCLLPLPSNKTRVCSQQVHLFLKIKNLFHLHRIFLLRPFRTIISL